MLLPDHVLDAIAASPPSQKGDRPPSPSYLYDQDHQQARPPQMKSRLGLMSRKRAMQRSQTAEKIEPTEKESTSRTTSGDQTGTAFFASPLGSNPVTSLYGHPYFVPEPQHQSSANTGLPQEVDFGDDARASLDMVQSDIGTLEDGEGPFERTYEQDSERARADRSSAALSKRAELILANAKKRLNVSKSVAGWSFQS